MVAKSKIIWRFVDNKPGHENQTQGLVEALREYLPLQSIDIGCQSFWQAITSFLLRNFPLVQHVAMDKVTPPKPDLIIGAGHRTHLSMLAAKRTWAAPTVVLMKPSLPRRLFDMCLVPAHDRVRASERVVVTDGVLNRIKPDVTRVPGSGLILIGGPSKHFEWSTQHVLQQIEQIILNSDIYFTVVTSRRTPDNFADSLTQKKITNLALVLAEDTETGWLAEQLPRSETVWITEDSVSMVYEALSAGAACGEIQVTAARTKGSNRILEGLEKLKRKKLLLSFDDWRQGASLLPPQDLLAEASRCAKIIAEKWLIKE